MSEFGFLLRLQRELRNSNKLKRTRSHLGFFVASIFMGGSLLGGCAASPLHESTGEYVDNSVITTKVKTALLRCPMVSGMDVHVETFKNRVQLSGFVDGLEQADQALLLTREIEGVGSVENRMSIK
jgi:hyperosmotically inducible periplasmic protein